MVDLSQLATRQQQQARVTAGREGIIPSRRMTEVAPLQVNADMRTARRGDGAEQLRQIFGAVADAGEAISARNAEKRKQQDRADTAQGALDQARGTVDPVKAERSDAYRRALAAGNTRSRYDEFRRTIETEAEAMMADANDPATPEEALQHINARFREFTVEKDGKLRDFGSHEANLFVAESWQKDAGVLLDKVAESNQQHLVKRGRDNALQGWTEAAARGGDANIEPFVAMLVPGTDIPAFKRELIGVAVSQAGLLVPDSIDEMPAGGLPEVQSNIARAKSMLDGLAASKRPDGTPSFSATEVAEIKDQRARLAAQADGLYRQAEGKAQDATRDKFRDRLNGMGAYPTKREIIAARQAGTISSEHADGLLGNIEADEREARAEARSAASEARARRAEAADNAENFGPSAQLLAEVYSGRMSVGKANGLLVQMGAAGYFGGGKARKKLMSQTAEELGKIESLRKGAVGSIEFRSNLHMVNGVADELRRQARSANMPIGRRKKLMDRIGELHAIGVTSIGKAYVERGGGNLQGMDENVGRWLQRELQGEFRDFHVQ